MRQVIDGAFFSMLEARDLCVRTPMSGMFGGNRRSRAYGSSAEFADFREYIPGDDLRRIDWNLYARFEKLFLKLYVDERRLHHRIYLDASASMDWGEPNKGDLALRLAAALGYLAVQSTDRVSIYAVHGSKCQCIARNVGGREAFYQAADELNHLEFYGNSDLEAALGGIGDMGYDDGISVILSDLLTESNWKNAVEQMHYRKRQVHLVQILSADELGPVMNGKLMLLDAEASAENDRRNYRIEVNRAAAKAYQEALSWYLKDIHQFCAQRNVGYVQVCTDESIQKILFQHATEAELIL